MAAWVIAAIERLPPGARRGVVAATALLLLAGAIMSMALEADRGREAGGSTTTVRAQSRRAPAQLTPPRLRPPVSAPNLRLASRVGRRFLLSYLQFVYGRARPTSVEAITPGLRSQLIGERAQVTPAERRRNPRVLSLRLVGTTPGFVVATATVEDEGIAAYRLRFTLQERAGRWLASGVQEG